MYSRQFIHTFREAVRDSVMPAAYKLLLFTMSTYGNGEGGDVFPAQESLARAAGTTDRTVRRHLKHLQVSGWVELEKRGHSGDENRRTRSANRYQLRVGVSFTFKNGEVHLPPAETLHEPATVSVSETAPAPEAAPKRSRKLAPSATEPLVVDLPEVAQADDDGWSSTHS
jgi:DNA-binding transcriptional MocR family regulator